MPNVPTRTSSTPSPRTRTRKLQAASSRFLGAGAAGGGVGAIFTTIANNLPPDSSYKALLTAAVPFITLAVSGLWLFIKEVYIDPYAARKRHEATHAYITNLLEDAKKWEASVLANPNSTPRHKEEVRRQVERLELLLMKAIVQKVDLIQVHV